MNISQAVSQFSKAETPPSDTKAEEVAQEEQQDEQHQHEEPSEQENIKQVPLSALQKERKKRQELEFQLEWERSKQQQAMAAQQQPQEDDSSRYESATREELTRAQQETVRMVEEKIWIKNNPEKVEKINEFLPQFLKQRPNLASAISAASNRYEEAYTLMEALTPRQQQQVKQAAAASVKKEAPNAPGSVPKGAALNAAVDVMSMSDDEFRAWRASQKRRR